VLFEVIGDLSLNFVHGRILGGVKGAFTAAITGGNPLTGGISGFVRGGGGVSNGAVFRGTVARADPALAHRAHGHTIPLRDAGAFAAHLAFDPAVAHRAHGHAIPLRDAGAFAAHTAPSPKLKTMNLANPITFQSSPAPRGCPPGTVSTRDGCVSPVSPVGRSLELSTAVMGQYGAGELPMGRSVLTLDCRPGMVLGKDEICYNRRDISNKERKWPRGARPLGTPGEMVALRKAASFGRRMETTVKRMQKIGVLSKPAPRRSKQPKRLMAPSDGVRVVNVE